MNFLCDPTDRGAFDEIYFLFKTTKRENLEYRCEIIIRDKMVNIYTTYIYTIFIPLASIWHVRTVGYISH